MSSREYEVRDGSSEKMALTRGKIAIIVVVGLVFLAAIITPIAILASKETDEEQVPPVEEPMSERVNCFPESASQAVSLTKEKCEERGCVYDEKAAATDASGGSSQGVACYYSTKTGLRYSISHNETKDWGFRLYLESHGIAPFGCKFAKPVLDVYMLSDNLLRFTFDDGYASPRRYRVPMVLNLPQTEQKAANPLYELNITDNNGLSFMIIRKSTDKVIFDTSVGGLVLSDQFLQLASKLPSANVYGLGEHSRHTFRHQFQTANTWPAFSRDQPPGGDTNLYGVHPFYTCVEDEDGNTHGVFLLNSNAQEYALSPGPMLTWRTIGGVLDFFVFMGPSPGDVVQQYTEIIGRPVMPPYWSLGFQLCRYGYNSLANLQRAVNNTLKHNIPLDVQYADIDHMNERMIFTIDEANFGGLNDYFHSLQDGGMRTIIILDPCIISNVSGYEPYLEMKKVKGNIQWPDDFDVPANSSDTDGSILGYVWPKGKVVFPDYFKEDTQRVWKELIVKHRNNLTFDGLWIDMNEPANFGTNEERPWNWPEDARPYWSLKCANNRWDDPPYRPLAAYLYDSADKKKPLADKTLCMNSVQGEGSNVYRHYDVHSLYGWSQSPPTLEAARAATGERSLVISRSTFPGSGKYAGHWLGDNTSKWSFLKESIIGMMDFSLFGIPYIGADICGFFGNTTEELCLRWMQLGAFYPFSRNHNGIGNNDQDPGSFGDPVAAASREILETRYWLLPYLYTLFHEAHTQGKTVVRSLLHEFPTDQVALGIDAQFLWGPALLISPIMEQGQTELTYYIPEGRWYHFYTGELTVGPVNKTVAVTLTSKPELHLRGGNIIAMQAPANNTHFSRQNPLQLRAMLDKKDTEGGTAIGILFWDDGTSVDTYENGQYFLADFNIYNRKLRVTVIYSNSTAVPDVNTLLYTDVIVYGVTGASWVNVTDSAGGVVQNTFAFDPSLQKLNVTLTNGITLKTAFTLSWE